jgi:hypothetical protein
LSQVFPGQDGSPAGGGQSRHSAVTRSGTASEVLPRTLSAARDQGGPEGPPLRAMAPAAAHAHAAERLHVAGRRRSHRGMGRIPGTRSGPSCHGAADQVLVSSRGPRATTCIMRGEKSAVAQGFAPAWLGGEFRDTRPRLRDSAVAPSAARNGPAPTSTGPLPSLPPHDHFSLQFGVSPPPESAPDIEHHWPAVR